MGKIPCEEGVFLVRSERVFCLFDSHPSSVTVRRYVILMGVATLLSWAVWSLLLLTVDPGVSGPVGHAAFFITLLCALTGSFSLVGLGLRRIFARRVVLFRQIGTSFRQGFFFSLLLVGSLLLETADFLRWWNLIVYLLLLACIEFFFLAREQRPF